MNAICDTHISGVPWIVGAGVKREREWTKIDIWIAATRYMKTYKCLLFILHPESFSRTAERSFLLARSLLQCIVVEIVWGRFPRLSFFAHGVHRSALFPSFLPPYPLQGFPLQASFSSYRRSTYNDAKTGARSRKAPVVISQTNQICVFTRNSLYPWDSVALPRDIMLSELFLSVHTLRHTWSTYQISFISTVLHHRKSLCDF